MKNDYEITDLALSAFLLNQGFKFLGVKDNKDYPDRKLFCFARKQGKKIEDSVKSYYERRTRVEPSSYYYDLKLLKTKLFDKRSRESRPYHGRFSPYQTEYSKRRPFSEV